MHLKKFCVKNFRRLKDVVIDLAQDISIFVGANNSGKTAVGHALQLFTGKSKFTLHDFSVDLWPQFSAFGNGEAGSTLPTMSVDIWFEIGDADLHRVINLLPNLSWHGTLVGMRVSYAPIDPDATRSRYQEARNRALAAVAPVDGEPPSFDPSPKDLRDYLRERLHDEYGLHYYVLDPSRFGPDMQSEAGYEPATLVAGRDRSGREVLNSLIQVDFLHAQRHLSDSPGGARAEDLSRVLSRFYGRNLEQKGDDIDSLRALANSESALNEHLQRVFEPTLESLSKLGYPGLTNPRLVIKTALDPAALMSSRDGARVHYAVGSIEEGVDPPTLPDRYNGLGFKNLIFMVVELLDLHAQWLAITENRPPLHLIFIEEPEAHLHAQLQQTFIRKVLDILELGPDDTTHYHSQVVVTTHSSHILYERGFLPIRYFRRNQSENAPSSQVLNLSLFHAQTAPKVRNFLERYVKLTHCDLYFADAAILVEGNVERLLLPQMIARVAPRLQSTYLSILEIGGAFGHRFKPLIEFLGITALIVTDLDSVFAPPPVLAADGAAVDAEQLVAMDIDDVEGGDEEEVDPGEGVAHRSGETCLASVPGAVTSNQTLIQWLPGCRTIAELFAATPEQKTQTRDGANPALVHVTYQGLTPVTWAGVTTLIAGRTLEEAFALENLTWTQDAARKPLQLRIPGAATKDLQTLVERIHKRVKGSNFNKTDFALALLAEDPAHWIVPTYIAEGLQWLENEVAPIVLEAAEHQAALGVPIREAA